MPETLRLLEQATENEAKKVLATEVTRLAHGSAAADQASETARRTFEEGSRADALPTVEVPRSRLASGIAAYELLHEAGLADSRNEARKLIKGGGGRLNDKPFASDTATVGEADLDAFHSGEIGDGVLIGAGASIIGNITVGRCARVAAGSVVLKAVPNNVTVAGVPAKVVGDAPCEEPSRTMDHMFPG